MLKYKPLNLAGVMELADVTDSKSVSGNRVWVRVPPPAPNLDGFLIQFIKNPFVLFLALIFVDLSMFFKTEGAVIVSAIPVCGCIFAYYYPLKTLIAKAIVSKGSIVSKSKAIVSTVKKVIGRMGF